MKLEIEKYTSKWNTIITQLKHSEFCDWFKANIVIGVIMTVIGLLPLLFARKLTPFMGSMSQEESLTVAILYWIMSFIITCTIFSTLCALTAIAFVRFMPRLLGGYLVINQAFMSYGIMDSIIKGIYDYNNSITIAIPWLIFMFLICFILTTLLTHTLVMMVIRGIDKRSKVD